MTSRDRDFLVVCATRYCLGRSSYIVGSMCDYLRKNAANIHPADRAVIVRDIDDQEDYGHAFDKDEWMRARAALIEAGRSEKCDGPYCPTDPHSHDVERDGPQTGSL